MFIIIVWCRCRVNIKHQLLIPGEWLSFCPAHVHWDTSLLPWSSELLLQSSELVLQSSQLLISSKDCVRLLAAARDQWLAAATLLKYPPLCVFSNWLFIPGPGAGLCRNVMKLDWTIIQILPLRWRLGTQRSHHVSAVWLMAAGEEVSWTALHKLLTERSHDNKKLF